MKNSTSTSQNCTDSFQVELQAGQSIYSRISNVWFVNQFLARLYVRHNLKYTVHDKNIFH